MAKAKYQKTTVGGAVMYLYPPTGFTTPHKNKMLNHIRKREAQAEAVKAEKAAKAAPKKPVAKKKAPTAAKVKE